MRQIRLDASDTMTVMAYLDWLNQDSLVWNLPMFATAGQPVGNPDFPPPHTWELALNAVARDLRCLRFGRDVSIDRLVWELSIHDDYSVSIGWQGADGLGGWSRGRGLTLDDELGDVTVWVADTVQDKLSGYEFVQWPSRGRYLLNARLVDGQPVWVDPHGPDVVAIGELCES